MKFLLLNKQQFPFIIFWVVFLSGCNRSTSIQIRQSNLPPAQKTVDPSAYNDSVELLNLLKSVYKWHAKNQAKYSDFDVIVKDSFQTGINYESFNKTFSALQQTNYFSTSFLDNYKKIADYVNNKLTTANPKYLNEINFSFQDADPWTGFQDDFQDFRDKLKITNYSADKNFASLIWRVQDNDWTSEKYAVRFTKENSKWRVAYLEGFDFVKNEK
jgi:hypothetical protein